MVSAISPADAVASIKDLAKANERIVLKSGVHCVSLVTPPTSAIIIKWEKYEEIFDALCRCFPDVERVALNTLGLSRKRLQDYKFCPPSVKEKEIKETTRLDRKFYNTMVLFCLIQERPLDSVLKEMELTRGEIRKLQEDAALFCRTTVTFCRELNWKLLAAVLSPYSEQLNYGVPDELLELARLGLDLMSSERARVFYRAGLRTMADVATADQSFIARTLIDALPVDSDRPTNAQRMLVPHADGGGRAKKERDIDEERTGASIRALVNRLQRRAAQCIQEKNSLSALLRDDGVEGII